MSAVARTARRLVAKGIAGTHAAVYRATVGKMVGQMLTARCCSSLRREVQSVKREGLGFHAVLTEGGAERLEVARV